MARLFNQTTVAAAQAQVLEQDQSQFNYIGFSSKRPEKNFKLYDIDLVKQDLINHFYIRKGEKLENPEFGTVIWDMLFEQFTESVKQMIAKDVEDIVNYDPRISVERITVDSTDIGIRIEASLRYLPFNVVEQMTLTFDKENSVII